MPRARQDSGAVDVDCKQFVRCRLQDVVVDMDLHEFAPVGGWVTSGCERRRVGRFAEMCQDLPNCPRFRDERDPPDVAAAVRALERKPLLDSGNEFRPRNPRGVVRAGLCLSVAAAFRGGTVSPMPAGRGLAPLADVADRQRRDGFPEPVIQREYSVLAMPMLPRRRDEIGEPVQELKRCGFDDAIRTEPRGRAVAAGSDPVDGFMSGQHVANFGCAAVWAASHGEPLKRE